MEDVLKEIEGGDEAGIREALKSFNEKVSHSLFRPLNCRV